MHIVLTGATGTLGSKLLFTLLESQLPLLTKVYLPIRAKKRVAPQQRLENMIFSDFVPPFIKKHQSVILSKLQVVDIDTFLKPHCFIKGVLIDYFIHAAGFVNLSTDPDAKKAIFKENLDFTKLIFNVYVPFIQKFIYISTAFANGDQGGIIHNDYTINTSKNYRNAYEASKHEAEQFLLTQSIRTGVPVQILRPSVLGGNISDAPQYFMSKYMVFYLFAKFFKNCDPNEAIRITTSSLAGLNIIPTDYAAKVILKAMSTDILQLNIVNTKDTNLIAGMTKIFTTVGFSNFSFTTEVINEVTGYLSDLERMYYQTIGSHLTPYLISKPNTWSTELLEGILPIPTYEAADYLSKTVTFAMHQKFRAQKW
ncbi:SDR family oxidoreductase [Arenibacter sp. GZD96]|uniref:SDR family oxidoreductase n=1 Tax=Aurantibrevibacter litoralis TaxID=3106030 RepID=UPI002AFFB922|nr:SDR family oxidoreductase [Arenibacter sp. GZD-96]MEA1785653.1 SDR family oxidoreductase [Arenibacter sp. GZD-96]